MMGTKMAHDDLREVTGDLQGVWPAARGTLVEVFHGFMGVGG